METYNRVFWGQKQWLERGRKAGKKPVMTSTYNASIKSMADGLFNDFSVEKGVTITPENTRWIAKQLNSELQGVLPGITKLKNFLQELALILAENGEDFGFLGPVTRFNYKRRYREAETIRINHKSKQHGTIRLSHAIGDKDHITDKALKMIKNGVVANFTHALDKELVGWLYLYFGEDLLTIHDAFGARAADMDKLYEAVRKAHKDIFSRPVLQEILEQNMSKEKAQEALADLMVNTWDVEDTDHNQHNYGKSGKPNKEKNLNTIYDRAKVDPSTLTDRTIEDADPSQPGTTIKYENGNISIQASPEYKTQLENEVKQDTRARSAEFTATQATTKASKLVNMSVKVTKGNGDVVNATLEAANIVAAIDKANRSMNDITKLGQAIEEIEAVTDAYKKVIRGAENKLHNAFANSIKEQYLVYYLNLVNQTEGVESQVKVAKYEQSFADLAEKALPDYRSTNPQPIAQSGGTDPNTSDNRTCEN